MSALELSTHENEKNEYLKKEYLKKNFNSLNDLSGMRYRRSKLSRSSSTPASLQTAHGAAEEQAPVDDLNYEEFMKDDEITILLQRWDDINRQLEEKYRKISCKLRHQRETSESHSQLPIDKSLVRGETFLVMKPDPNWETNEKTKTGENFFTPEDKRRYLKYKHQKPNIEPYKSDYINLSVKYHILLGIREGTIMEIAALSKILLDSGISNIKNIYSISSKQELDDILNTEPEMAETELAKLLTGTSVEVLTGDNVLKSQRASLEVKNEKGNETDFVAIDITEDSDSDSSIDGTVRQMRQYDQNNFIINQLYRVSGAVNCAVSGGRKRKIRKSKKRISRKGKKGKTRRKTRGRKKRRKSQMKSNKKKKTKKG